MTTTTITHDADIQTTVNLEQAAPTAVRGILWLIVDKATNTLNSVKTVLFSTLADAKASNTAGYISAATLEACRVGFSQKNAPTGIRVVARDTVGTETVEACLTAAELIARDYDAVCIYSRVDADILALSAACESRNVLALVQTNEAGFLTATYPAGLTAWQTRENSAIVWHTTDTEWNDVAWAADRISFDPDEVSAPWGNSSIREVAANTNTIATEANRGYLATHFCNVMLPLGANAKVMKNGKTTNGNDIASVVTKFWFKRRVLSDIAALLVTRADRGAKTPVDPTGQALIGGALKAILQTGEAVGHFVAEQGSVIAQPISDADTAANRLRFTVGDQLALQVDVVANTVNFTETAAA